MDSKIIRIEKDGSAQSLHHPYFFVEFSGEEGPGDLLSLLENKYFPRSDSKLTEDWV